MSHAIARLGSQLTSTRLDAFDQSAAGEIVRFQTATSHQAEVLPCLIHLIAPHEDIDQGVVRDKGRREPNFLNSVEQLSSLLMHPFL